MTKRAILFPGQGAQHPGMGKEFYEAFASVRERFEEAEDLLHEPFSKICFEGPEGLLKKTAKAQPALFVVGAALFDLVRSQSKGFSFDFALGLSLGEYTALYALEALSFQEALSLVAIRGKLMEEACGKNRGGMAAVLGLSQGQVEAVVRDLHLPDDLFVANFNAPSQIVISGTEKGIREGSFRLQEAGAKKVLPLEVEGAFHSGLMKGVEAPLREAIRSKKWQKPNKPLVMNLTGKVSDHIEEIMEGLVSQVSHSVRWQESIEGLHKGGVLHYVEFGPGRTLSALNKRISSDLVTHNLEKVADLEHILSL
jgi:[acyl-carrier-protein] S-malonyltransferase